MTADTRQQSQLVFFPLDSFDSKETVTGLVWTADGNRTAWRRTEFSDAEIHRVSRFGARQRKRGLKRRDEERGPVGRVGVEEGSWSGWSQWRGAAGDTGQYDLQSPKEVEMVVGAGAEVEGRAEQTRTGTQMGVNRLPQT